MTDYINLNSVTWCKSEQFAQIKTGINYLDLAGKWIIFNPIERVQLFSCLSHYKIIPQLSI